MHCVYCYFIIIQLLTFYTSNCYTLQCKDESNNPVDWFYMYKLPRQKGNLNPLLNDGVAYMYVTPANVSRGWILSNFSVEDRLSMLGRTLTPLYKDKNVISLVYNDQPPQNEYTSEVLEYIPLEKQSRRNDFQEKKPDTIRNEYYHEYDVEEKGHTKGVILGDMLSSFWLVHSVPKFPPAPTNNGDSDYKYPPTGRKYGQALLCMSVHTQALDKIAVQLKYNEPLVIYSSIPNNLVKELPNLVDVMQNKTINSSPWYHTLSFETLGGNKYSSFAKNANFHDDLYSGLVAQSLKSDLLVESWINGPSILDSDCTRQYQVHNIESLMFPNNLLSFSSHYDHSKWAIAAHRNVSDRNGLASFKFWICVGDINRAVSQESRGGGTVCTLNQDVWNFFAQLIKSVQQCKI